LKSFRSPNNASNKNQKFPLALFKKGKPYFMYGSQQFWPIFLVHQQKIKLTVLMMQFLFDAIPYDVRTQFSIQMVSTSRVLHKHFSQKISVDLNFNW